MKFGIYYRLQVLQFGSICIETVISELPVKIPTTVFDSLTPCLLWMAIFGNMRTFSVDFSTGQSESAMFLLPVCLTY